VSVYLKSDDEFFRYYQYFFMRVKLQDLIVTNYCKKVYVMLTRSIQYQNELKNLCRCEYIMLKKDDFKNF